jgi:hypothetical protein
MTFSGIFDFFNSLLILPLPYDRQARRCGENLISPEFAQGFALLLEKCIDIKTDGVI